MDIFNPDGDIMLNGFEGLFGHEREAMLEALRRDLQSQLKMARENPQNALIHYANVRAVKRILEVLNPRGIARNKHD